MKTSRLLLLALALCAALPAAAQITDTYVITASASVTGANNTKWLTQLSIFNPHLDHPLTVSVTLIRTGGAVGLERLIEIPENATFITDDAMKDIFETNGTGSLLLATFPEDNPGVEDSIIARSFLVSSNTYNNAANGTFGQTIPGVWTGLLDYDSDQITSIAHGIDNSARLKFRTNVGALNLGRCGVTVYVTAYDAGGATVLNEVPLVIPPLAHWQERLPGTLEGGSVEFWVSDPCAADDDKYAVVFPYTSTIDDLSGDPRYQTPALLASPGLIYGKKGIANADPTNVGKKIDVAYARRVRAMASRMGSAHLVRTERGWMIER